MKLLMMQFSCYLNNELILFAYWMQNAISCSSQNLNLLWFELELGKESIGNLSSQLQFLATKK